MKWSYYLSKPAVLLMLLFFFRIHSGETKYVKFRNLMITGFLFSAAGDTLLMFSKESEGYFIAGLVAFLLAHIAYMAGFIIQIFESGRWNQHWSQLAFSTLIVVYGAEFFILNRESFGNLKIPVMLYCVAITAMGVAAVMRDKEKNYRGYFKVVTGAVFFIVSDSLLAIYKFRTPFPADDLLILSTYFIAQYLIAMGTLADMVKVPQEVAKAA